MLLGGGNADLLLVEGNLVHVGRTLEPLRREANQCNIRLTCPNIEQRVVGARAGDLPPGNPLVEAPEPFVRLHARAKDNF